MFLQYLYSASFISFQSASPPMKDQRDVGLDGNLFFQILLVPVGDQKLRETPAC